VNGGGRQLASKIELPSIHLPCLAACQASCLASKFRKVNGHTGHLTCSKLQFTYLASLLASCKPALRKSEQGEITGNGSVKQRAILMS
jgi:hypothetical protein